MAISKKGEAIHHRQLLIVLSLRVVSEHEQVPELCVGVSPTDLDTHLIFTYTYRPLFTWPQFCLRTPLSTSISFIVARSCPHRTVD
jgi:hypothetical protein